jgi:hypothetical protein
MHKVAIAFLIGGFVVYVILVCLILSGVLVRNTEPANALKGDWQAPDLVEQYMARDYSVIDTEVYKEVTVRI